MMQPTVDQAWAAQSVATLPTRWQGRLLRAWERDRRNLEGVHWTAESEAQRRANLALLRTTDELIAHRLNLDASDSEICTRADEQAERCAQLAQVYHQPEALRAAMARMVRGQGIDPPHQATSDSGAMQRMTCPMWWRRQLRKVQAKRVEGAAIAMGLVHKRQDIYVSNESLHRRQQQNRRNAAALENTIAENEQGQQFTLAELAAKGPANKAIRRAELMTRISGFERIARDMGHAGLFLTITCPSRMHKWRTVNGGGVIENPRYDGTSPRAAQAYLAKVWARIRAALKRQGVGLYGFRIAEPNHDGTPHWHLLTFQQADHLAVLQAVIWRYALADSPDEPGAHTHRVDFKPIDWSRGSAAGYVAKYVAKNIDGYRLESDLYGNPALETSARVEAWAATWGIRQFQQVGGPPVGPWRELRRVESVPEQAPDHLKAAHRAVNKLAVIEGRENQSVAWDHYCKAQGGVFVGRSYRIRIATEQRDGVGRYGEPLPPAPVGVETAGTEHYTPAHMAHMTPAPRIPRLVHWFVASVRHAWIIVSRAGRGMKEGFKRACAPWTRVNNCTQGEQNGSENQPICGSGTGAFEVGRGPGPCESDGGGLCGAAA